MNHALVVIVEGLSPGLVGAYGSSTARTPAIDRLAASGVLLDQCFVDSLDLAQQLCSLWTGRHALQPESRDWTIWKNLPQGCESRLFTDCERVAELATQYGCPTVTLVQPAATSAPAHETTACAVMELFAAAAQSLGEGTPGLMWIHSRGLRHAWDAPLELRAAFADPDDPLPPGEVLVPSMEVNHLTDPDLVIGWNQVAAAQAAVIDEAISGLIETLESREDARQWSCLLSSLAGVPLGQHGRLGWGKSQLFGEELHLATVLLPAQQLPIGIRRPELFQLPDLAATLATMLAVQGPSSQWGRNVLELGAADLASRWPHALRLAMIRHGSQQWIRSPAWSAILDSQAPEDVSSDDISSEDSARQQLYVKPEDRWEVSQVADRRRDIVLQFRELAPQFAEAAANNDRSLLPEIDDELINLMR